MIKELLGFSERFQRQNIAFHTWKIVKKFAEMFPKKRANAQILFKSPISAQECWKCKIVLQIRKRAEKCPAQYGVVYKLLSSELDLGRILPVCEEMVDDFSLSFKIWYSCIE